MADTSTKISGPVEIEQTSQEAVAFKLMQQISDYERSTSIAKDRKYWLSLYCQCYKATKGYALEDILVAD
jgi:hypothetical protein